MLMKPPAPASRGPKRLTLTWPSASTWPSQARHVEAAAIIEIELLALLNDGFGVDRSSEIETALWHSADDAGLRGQGYVAQYPLLVGNCRDALRHPDAEVDDTPIGNSNAQRRAMIRRSSWASGCSVSSGTLSSPGERGAVGVP